MSTRVKPYLPGATAIIVVALAILLLPWLGDTFFYSKGEPREAIVGMSIVESGNWILPLNYGGDIPFKPPFLGWLIAVFAYIFNGGEVNEYISRLPSALAAFAMIMGGYIWARRERDSRFALLFAFVTITTFEVFRAALACRLDMVLTACMTGSIYLMYHIREHKPRFKGLLLTAVVLLLSCATLTKGPIGSLLPCFIMGIYRLFRRDSFFPTLGKMLALVLLSLILPAWWFYAAYQQGGSHFYDLMMEENFGRLLGTMSYESHENPIWYNFVSLIAGLLPWTVLLIAGCFSLRRVHAAPLKPARLLCAVAAVTVIVFYSIPESKRAVYLLPAYPFICYGIASILDYRASSGAVRFFAWFMSLLAVVAPLAIVALQIWPQPQLPLASVPWWGYLVLILPLTAGIAWMLNRHSASGHLCVIVWALFVAYAAVGMPMVLNPKSDRNIIDNLIVDSPATVVTLGETRQYSLNFYMHDILRRVHSINDAEQYPAGSKVIFGNGCDTTGISRSFDVDTLTKRSADYRNTLFVATKK